MISMAESEEIRRKHDGPYFRAQTNLKNDIFTLNELNKQLPKSIKESVDKKQKDFREIATKYLEKNKTDLGKFIKLYNKLHGTTKWKFWLYPRGSKAEKLHSKFVQLLELSPNFNMFIRDMSLVYLIAGFESYLKNIIEISIKKKPEILISSHKTIEYSELLKLNNLNEAKQNLIEKESNTAINQDIELVNKYLKDKFKLDVSQKTDWKKFKERFYRRNVLLHNSGHINKLYRMKTGYEGKDTRLTVSQEYLKESLLLFEMLSLEISAYFYNKFK